MLTNLLPGVRDLRTPMATGFTWLIALWLLLEDRVPRPAEARGALGSLYELAQAVDRPVLLAAITFAAYLFGALVEIDPGRLLRWWYQKADRPRSRLPKIRLLTMQAKLDLALLAAVAEARDERALGSFHLAMSTGANTYGVERDFFAELPNLATRLHAANKDLFDDYDRLVAEASLRFNMAPPLVALLGVLGIQWSWGWLLALPLPLALAYQGIARTRRAYEVVVQALVIGQVDSSTLNAMEEAVKRRFGQLDQGADAAEVAATVEAEPVSDDAEPDSEKSRSRK